MKPMKSIVLRSGELYTYIEGDVSVAEGEKLEINGLVTGNLEVSPHARVDVKGMVLHNLIAKEHSKAIINGFIVGSVINEGADVRVFGKVKGFVNDRCGVHTYIGRKAVIGGRRP